MTMVCRVDRRYPVAVAALSGSLDRSAATRAAVTLHGCLADQPVLQVLDVSELEAPATEALRPLAGLVDSAHRWPGIRVAVAGASAAVRDQLNGLVVTDALDFYTDVAAALAAGDRLPVPARETAELPPTRQAPALARELVAAVCQSWQLDRWSRLAQLLASELVTNAVVHAGTAISLTLRHADGELQVAVRDRDPRLVAQPPSGPVGLPAGEPGRGLLVLSTLADDWGSTPTSDGKVTWASVSLAPHGARHGTPDGGGDGRT
jgi:anti-sigma regulatory factor (Ser/Thr protein kinase)